MLIRADSTMKLASPGTEPSGAVAANWRIRHMLRATSRCPFRSWSRRRPCVAPATSRQASVPPRRAPALTVTSSRARRDGDAPIRRWSHVRLASFQRWAAMAVTSAPPAAASSAASPCKRSAPAGYAGSCSSALSAWSLPGEITSNRGPLTEDFALLARTYPPPRALWHFAWQCPPSAGMSRVGLRSKKPVGLSSRGARTR